MTDTEKATIEALDHAISVLESVKDSLIEIKRAYEGKGEK